MDVLFVICRLLGLSSSDLILQKLRKRFQTQARLSPEPVTQFETPVLRSVTGHLSLKRCQGRHCEILSSVEYVQV